MKPKVPTPSGKVDLSWILVVLFRTLSIFVLTLYLNLFGFPTFWSRAYLMKVNPEKRFIRNKIGIYSFITTTGSIPLLVDC